jgi:hypothetical protein
LVKFFFIHALNVRLILEEKKWEWDYFPKGLIRAANCSMGFFGSKD